MIKAKVTGGPDIMAALRELPKAVGRAALVRVGVARLQPMCDAAADNAPEDEGDLKDSMAVSTRQGNAKARRARVQSKATVEIFMGPTDKGYPQAIPQEMGSRNNPPSGYMRKAFDEHHEAVVEGIGEDLGAEITKTAERRARRAAGGA